MNTLYLFLDLGTILVPFLYSILEKKFYFWQYAKFAFLSIFLVAIPFLIWDAYFTKIGVWGFNDRYHLPFTIFKMPIEEWLFFFCVPYACLFTHEGFKYYFPKFKLSKNTTQFISICLLVLVTILLVTHFGRWYTSVNFVSFLLLMIYALIKHTHTLQYYYPSFLIILIPFFIVNGVLTGACIEDQVVWYNNDENLGFRLGTIPFEDVFYAFNMLFSAQILFNFFKFK